MEAVGRGGDRQELHEQLRVLAMEAGRRVKEEGESNDYIARVAGEAEFGMTREELEAILDGSEAEALDVQQRVGQKTRRLIHPHHEGAWGKFEINFFTGFD